MAALTHTVKRGDTLSSISSKYKISISDLVKLNDITDPNYLVIGQVLRLSDQVQFIEVKDDTKPAIKAFGLQSNTDRTVYATWRWDKKHTDHYKILWQYDTGDGIWFNGEDSTTTSKQCTYTGPSNAKRVRFKVKAISKTRKVNDVDMHYWTSKWSTLRSYSFEMNPPTTPPVPSVTIENTTLTAKLNNLSVNATHIQFQIVKDDSSIFNTGNAQISTDSASYACTVDVGGTYKVRCRSYKNDEYSGWSEYSDPIETIPSGVSGITACRAASETSVYLEWSAVSSATSYDIEYTTEARHFDGSNNTSTISGVTTSHYEITGLETGDEYFFRVRSVNSKGSSSWSGIKSTIIGKKPAAPTTWSSTTTIVSGSPLTLYWMHNSEDGSKETYAELELDINGTKNTYTIPNTKSDSESDIPSTYVIQTSNLKEGAKIKWRVRTSGITKEYGEWSILRTVVVYAKPTLQLNIKDSSGTELDVIESFPFYISGIAGPNTQQPIGYHLTIEANETYDGVDRVGNDIVVSKGTKLYSKHFDINGVLNVTMSAEDVDLENNISYTVTCVVSMNSGLTAEAKKTFVVAWGNEEYAPNAEIAINPDEISASIRPYCEDEDGNLIEGVVLSVYRREFDGSFVEIAKNVENSDSVFITDPHPALDFARYRIIATSITTGGMSYNDLPPYPVNEKAVIIQWDEQWSYFDTTNEDELVEPPWSGSLLKLPYNIDVADKNKVDVSLVKYTGRKHPVSYYGTQIDTTSTWSVDIDKTDKETLYALRRLSVWTGNVYVREPSGSGYWANISVSFTQTHCKVVIPVTIEITRVEGGM